MTTKEAIKAVENILINRVQDIKVLEMVYNASRIHYRESKDPSEKKELEMLIFQLESYIKDIRFKNEVLSDIDGKKEVIKDIYRWAKGKLKSKLSAFEVALKHQYLVEAKIEQYIISAAVGKKYNHIANSTNIAMAHSAIITKARKANLKQLQNILSDLEEFPMVQKAILNDIKNL